VNVSRWASGNAGRRCATRPGRAASRWRNRSAAPVGSALVAARQGATRAPSILFRLTRPRGEGAPLTLVIGDRRFALASDRESARAGDPETDRAIVGAMRGATGMTLTTLDAAGRPLGDTYPLAGAATAIDAAQLGCARR